VPYRPLFCSNSNSRFWGWRIYIVFSRCILCQCWFCNSCQLKWCSQSYIAAAAAPKPLNGILLSFLRFVTAAVAISAARSYRFRNLTASVAISAAESYRLKSCCRYGISAISAARIVPSKILAVVTAVVAISARLESYRLKLAVVASSGNSY
jgi:hypothetical protein